jgi:hypothetical protein
LKFLYDLLDWCTREFSGRSKSALARTNVESHGPCPPVRWFVSKQRGSRPSPHPAICYGHQAEAFAESVAESSSLNTLVPEDLEGLAHVCQCPAFSSIGLQFAALIARSRPGFNGEAGEAIRVFQGKQRKRAASFYGAWDYNVARAAARALEYQADGIVMPGTDANELFAYLFGVMSMVDAGSPPPKTPQEHVDRLKEFVPDSPFWKHQDRIQSENY